MKNLYKNLHGLLFGSSFLSLFCFLAQASATTLSFSTFLGGNDYEDARSVSVDGSGNCYVTGFTGSSNFPTTSGAFDTLQNGLYDAFVSKLNSTGSSLSYSTFLGGNNLDYSRSISVDGSGNCYVTGFTGSSNFPTTSGAFDTSHNGSDDAFVSKLNPTGTGLSYSTFIGGSSNDYARTLAVDGSGNPYIGGYTESSNFPTTSGAFDTSHNGYYDAFVSKLNSTGTGLSYSTFIGGSSYEEAYSLAVDGSGNAYIGGYTESSNFPTTSGAFDTSQNGDYDAFVSKLNSTGSSLSYSTYLGGSSTDFANSLAVDGSGNAYTCGYTTSTNFPTTSGAFDTSQNGYYDAFVSKLNSTGSSLSYSTFLGGSSSELGYSVSLDGSGNCYVTGETVSSDFPTTVGAYDTSLESWDAFVTKLNSSGSTLDYSTFLGGSIEEYRPHIFVDGSGNCYVTGETNSSDFPTTVGAYDTSHNGAADVFVSKFLIETIPPPSATLPFSTFLGGSNYEESSSVSVDGSGDCYVTGYTYSSNFPTTSGAFDTSQNGNFDAFVCKINSTGSSLSYSTFLGGSGYEHGFSISVDGSGNCYFSGETGSSNFPTTYGAYDNSFNVYDDTFLTKLNSTGSSLTFSTFLGGTWDDVGQSLSVDGSGNCYITGGTNSTDFPTTSGAFDTSQNGDYDVFVTKLNSSGSALAYSTFIGGTFLEGSYSVSVDGSGNCYVTGRTNSTDFPMTVGAFDTSYNYYDVFVTKLNSTGSSLSYSTYLGGSGYDQAYSLAVDGSGNAYIGGYTESSNFPTTSGAFDTSQNGSYDAFVSKLNSTGSSLSYSTYLGGSSTDLANSLALDGSGNAYIGGFTESSNFPTTSGAFDTSQNGDADVFVSKFFFETIPPSAVTDLVLTGFSQGNPIFSFTSVGDNSTSGTAAFYVFGYSATELTEANFNSAMFVNSLAVPQASGNTETITLTGLSSTTTLFYFGVKVYDGVGNASPVSNIVTNFDRAGITSIADVNNDNGKQVRITFDASLNDSPNSNLNVGVYAVYRKVNPLYTPSGKVYTNQTLESLPSGTWEVVGTVPPFGETSYTTVVPTLADSNSTGTHDFEFLVRAQAFNSLFVSSVSAVVSGYSKDNLAPPTPASPSFTNNGNGTITASWNKVYASDLAFYTIYVQFSDESYSLVSQVVPSGSAVQSYTFSAVPNAFAYFVGSLDENGNEGLPPFDRITSLEVEVVGNDVVLNWLGKQNAVNYKIYRSLTPDFVGSVQIGTTQNPTTVFTDSGAAGSTKYFYFVTWSN